MAFSCSGGLSRCLLFGRLLRRITLPELLVQLRTHGRSYPPFACCHLLFPSYLRLHHRKTVELLPSHLSRGGFGRESLRFYPTGWLDHNQPRGRTSGCHFWQRHIPGGVYALPHIHCRLLFFQELSHCVDALRLRRLSYS